MELFLKVRNNVRKKVRSEIEPDDENDQENHERDALKGKWLQDVSIPYAPPLRACIKPTTKYKGRMKLTFVFAMDSKSNSSS